MRWIVNALEIPQGIRCPGRAIEISGAGEGIITNT